MKLENARVLFINMPVREGAAPNNPPLGILYLCAVLREHGITPQVLDLNIKRGPHGRFPTEQEARALIEQSGEFDLVGMSGLITTLRWQKIIAGLVRDVIPATYLVSGGGLATHFGRNLFQWIPQLNAVACGEGEEIILDIVGDAMKSKQQLPAARVFVGSPVRDLDSLPFPDHATLSRCDIEAYISSPVWGADARNSSAAPFSFSRSLSMISSRGCPHSCAFCFRGTQGQRKYRCRSAKSVADEMLYLKTNHNLDFVGMVDDNAIIEKARLDALVSELGRSATWGTHGRLDDAAAHGRCAALAAAGCRYLGFGAESASESILRRMNKGKRLFRLGSNEYGTPKIMHEGIKAATNSGIHPNCTWIMGYPGETLDDLRASVLFMQWMREIVPGPVNEMMFCATAYPGTAMFDEPIVQEKLSQAFGIRWDSNGDPVFDASFEKYVLELDDASKVVSGDVLLNYSDMPDDVFLQARECIENGATEEILRIRA